MKKILFLFITILILVSCNNSGVKTATDVNGGIRGSVIAKEFSYNGHNYIEFKDVSMYGQGFVHDPNCLKNDIDSLINK